MDSLLGPLDATSPLLGLGIVSFLTALVAVLVYRVASPQQRIARSRERMTGQLLGVLVYSHRIGSMAGCLAGFGKDTARYLVASLVPLAILIVPVTLMLIALDDHYGYRALESGERAVVFAESDSGGAPEVRPPDGVTVETEPIPVPSERRTVWRVRVDSPGKPDLGAGLTVDYPARSIQVGRYEMHWLSVFIILVLLFGWGLAKTFGIEI